MVQADFEHRESPRLSGPGHYITASGFRLSASGGGRQLSDSGWGDEELEGRIV